MRTLALMILINAFLLATLIALLQANVDGMIRISLKITSPCSYRSRYKLPQIVLQSGSSVPFSISFFFCYHTLFAELISCISEFKEHGKAISRGGHNGAFSFANFKQDKFSYLNVTVLEKRLVDQMPECSFACLETSCFSFNLNAFPDIDNKLLCELLPTDKYNNTNQFIFSNVSHHFSIMVS